MRVHHLQVASAYLDKASSSPAEPSPPFPSSAVFPFAFRCLRPLAPKISLPDQPPRKMIAPADVLGRVRNSTKLLSCTVRNHTVQVPVGGATRWNPSAEQIKVLEALYRGGMRTPNAAQIEQITEELGKHGRIEGKNVFYWFQNHKARERQKQKRAALLTLSTLDSPSLPVPATTTTKVPTSKEAGDDEPSCKRRRTAWSDRYGDVATITELAVACSDDDVTLELFPLRPQGKV